MLALLQQYKLIAAAVAVAALMALSAGAAWKWQAYRYEAKIAKAETAISTERTEAMRLILAEQESSHRRMAEADKKATQELSDADLKITDLEQRVAAGPARLYVAAKCPTNKQLPEAGATPGLGGGGGERAELDPAFRPSYFALRRGIVKLEAALDACVNGR